MRAAAALLAFLPGAAAVGADIRAFEKFTPRVVSSSFAKASDKYAENVQVAVTFKGVEFLLDLAVNRELFAPDWSLEEYDNAGKLVRRVTNAADFMCHYTGAVRGYKESYVTMSLCEDLGMRGHVHTSLFDIEVQHAVPLDVAGPKSVTDGHIVFDLKDLKLDGFTFGEPILGHANLTKPPHHPLPRRYSYSNSAVVASDSYRMNAFSSSNAEATNTQSVMNHANSPYSATSWGSGNTLRHTIRSQAQNPSGWSHSNNMNNNLDNLVSYRRNQQSGADNVQGFTHYSYGGTIGLAYVATMCGSHSAGLNNVGFTSSDSTRGILVAHEMGHNYAFQHDSNNQGGSGYVMWPSINSNARQFSSYSVSSWNSYRGRFNCL